MRISLFGVSKSNFIRILKKDLIYIYELDNVARWKNIVVIFILRNERYRELVGILYNAVYFPQQFESIVFTMRF